MIVVPIEQINDSHAVAQEIVGYLAKTLGESPEARKGIDIMAVAESGTLNYAAITRQLRMSLRFLNVGIRKFDGTTRTYTIAD